MEREVYKIGDDVVGFHVENVEEIRELECTLIELTHKATGAQVLHIAADDPENLFCLSFQTLPENSRGTAHILEHTVLCGSKKYPVRDPFFTMTRRSLNTFMNALTGQDFTCYPAATQVEQDFYNLLEVYLDAVFHPLLTEDSFRQEGWRYEFQTTDDPSSALCYKGVVLNEMKGALSSATARLNESLGAALFPSSPYGYNSGGDPKFICDLTYAELKAFHARHYHPGRCLFYFYGNFPLRKHLEFISRHALTGVHPLPPDVPLIPQRRFVKPKRIVDYYPETPTDSLSSKTHVAFAWLTCSIRDQLTLLALSVLDIILMETDGSLLRYELIRSGLCRQAQSALESEMAEVPYAIILRGCDAEQADAIEALLRVTLQNIADSGIPTEKITSALHQLELARSEITGDSFPFGLNLFMRSGLIKQHGGTASAGLVIHTLFDELRDKLQTTPRYLEHLIQTELLDNPHFVRLVMAPKIGLAEEEEAEEREQLRVSFKGMTHTEKKAIIEESKKLIAIQEEDNDQNINVLPKICLADVPKHTRKLALEMQKVGNVSVFHHPTFTNNITYTDLIFPLPRLANEDLFYTRLYASILTQVGAAGRNFQENLAAIEAHTGGIQTALSLNIQAHNWESLSPTLHIRGKALGHKASNLYGLLFDTATAPNFTDYARLKDILLKQYTALESSLTQNSLRYAMNLSARSLSTASYIASQWHGLEYFYTLKHLVHSFETEAEKLVANLERIHNLISCTAGAELLLTCDGAAFTKGLEESFGGLTDLSVTHYEPWANHFPIPHGENAAYLLSTPVAFTSVVFKTISYDRPDAPYLSLAAALFDNITLHKRIREQGGAYGAGASSNTLSGNFYFYSFRDPQLAASLLAFQEAIERIITGDFDEKDLEEAKLEVVQGLDAPIAPGTRGEVAWSWWRSGKTYEMRHAHRATIINATRSDVQKAVREHIAPQYPTGNIVTFCNTEFFAREERRLHELELPLLHPHAVER